MFERKRMCLYIVSNLKILIFKNIKTESMYEYNIDLIHNTLSSGNNK